MIAEQRIAERFLNDAQYNSLHRPTSDGGQKFSADGAAQVKLAFCKDSVLWFLFQVETSLFARAMTLDTVNMDFAVDITLRQSWRDPRLMFVGQVSHWLIKAQEFKKININSNK